MRRWSFSESGHISLNIGVEYEDIILSTYVTGFFFALRQYYNVIVLQAALKWKPYEPTAKERRQAEQIKKSQEERQKKR